MNKLTNYKLFIMFLVVVGIVSLSIFQDNIDSKARQPLSTKAK